MKNYIIINEDITSKFVSWKNAIYIKSFDRFGIIYIPSEEDSEGFVCPILRIQDIAFDSMA